MFIFFSNAKITQVFSQIFAKIHKVSSWISIEFAFGVVDGLVFGDKHWQEDMFGFGYRKIADVFPVFSLLRLHPPPKKVRFRVSNGTRKYPNC